MSTRITPASVRELIGTIEECRDCDGVGHILCPSCGHSDDEICSLEHDDERHIRCECCDGDGRVVRRPNASALKSAAPDLARAYLGLAAAVVALEAERDEALAEVERLRASLAVARRLVTEDNAALGDALGLSPQDIDQAVEAIRDLRTERDALRDGLRRALSRLGVQDCGADLVAALSSCIDDAEAREREAQEEHRALVLKHAATCAIIEGRTTPPTDAEVRAHIASGGSWRSVVIGEYILSLDGGFFDADDLADEVRKTIDAQRANARIVEAAGGARWWPCDGATARPCAWPTVTP